MTNNYYVHLELTLKEYKKNINWHKYISVLFIIVTFVWMGFIFYMSSKSASHSFAQSDNASSVIFSIFIPHFEEMDPAEQLKYINAIRSPIRKGAHFIEYTILGALICESVILWFNLDSKRIICIAIIIGISYAASDEFHQLFVSGRSGKLTDILVDTVGVITGVLIVIWINTKLMLKE